MDRTDHYPVDISCSLTSHGDTASFNETTNKNQIQFLCPCWRWRDRGMHAMISFFIGSNTMTGTRWCPWWRVQLLLPWSAAVIRHCAETTMIDKQQRLILSRSSTLTFYNATIWLLLLMHRRGRVRHTYVWISKDIIYIYPLLSKEILCTRISCSKLACWIMYFEYQLGYRWFDFEYEGWPVSEVASLRCLCFARKCEATFSHGHHALKLFLRQVQLLLIINAWSTGGEPIIIVPMCQCANPSIVPIEQSSNRSWQWYHFYWCHNSKMSIKKLKPSIDHWPIHIL